jgi:putative N6-adenine-specific DNA methylase
VSLDTSGELLYRRGLRKLVSEAPIRENLAHGLWRILADPPASSREVTLVDPMMGSGVFGLEARFADLVSSREYAYQHIPILQSAFASLHKAEMDIRMKKFIGFENSHSVVEAARQNFAGLGSVEVEVFEQDFFSPKKDFSLLKDETQETWVISNLPYGERIKIKDESLLSFYQRVVDEIETWCRPHRVGLLVADKFEPSRLRHKKWSTPQVFKFKNGGLEVQFLIWKRL